MNKKFKDAIKTIAIFGIIVILFSSLAAASTPIIPKIRAAGIDVSDYQHPNGKSIDWQKVYDAGIRFTWRKADQGKSDSLNQKFFKEDMDKGMLANVKMGAYHFPQPLTNKYNAKDEANHFIKVAGDYLKDGYLRPVLDVEDLVIYDKNGKITYHEYACAANGKKFNEGLTKAELTKWVIDFVSTVKEQTGVEPIIYTGKYYGQDCLDVSDPTLKTYTLWIAQNPPGNIDPDLDNPDRLKVSKLYSGIWEKWDFWQYCIPDGGCNAHIDGIGNSATLVDLDVLNGPESDLDKYVIHKSPEPPKSSLTVVSPNGGESWDGGSKQEIKWTYIGNPGEYVDVELLKNGVVVEGVGACILTSVGSVTLTMPNNPGEDYQVRITGINGVVRTEYTDISDGYFSIHISPKNLELVFAIDTTGSMWPYINAVKASMNEIITALDKEGFNYKIAVADYKDIPKSPYGDPSDYPYRLVLPFTGQDNKPVIVNAINSLGATGGADGPESVYTALVHAMEDPNKNLANKDNSGWTKGVTKVIIIMGDAPPHIPEPWVGGHTLADVISTSESIDPVIVYSVAVGSYAPAYSAFADISSGTNGKVYTSPTASGVVAAILEAIGDIGDTPVSRGVSLSIDPSSITVTGGKTANYAVDMVNTGTVADSYDISLELNNFAGFQRGYPVAIQPSWVIFNSAQATLDPGKSENRALKVTVPKNWAGMEDVTYNFDVTVTSTTDVGIGNTSSAELKVKADKRSMAEYSKLEIQWLREMIQGPKINNQGIKNALLAKLANAESKVDSAIANIDNDKFGNNLNTAQNMMTAFSNQVEAQYDKKITQPDAAQLEEKAGQILKDLEQTKNS